MGIGDPACDRQAKTRALAPHTSGITAVETIEYMRQLISRNSNPAVFNDQRYDAIGFENAETYLAPARRELDGVIEQDHCEASNQLTVAFDRRVVEIADDHSDLLRLRKRSRRCCCVEGEIVELKLLSLDFTITRIGASKH